MTEDRHVYLVVNIPTVPADEGIIAGHIAFLSEHAVADEIWLYGAFPAGAGGAYLVLADSEERAWQLVRTDPLFPVCEFSVRRWLVPPSLLDARA